MKEKSLNVYGKPLQICGYDPITGAFRDGCCNTGPGDIGTHTVCAIVSDEFLKDIKECRFLNGQLFLLQ